MISRPAFANERIKTCRHHGGQSPPVARRQRENSHMGPGITQYLRDQRHRLGGAASH